MRNLFILSILTVIALSVSGCDFFRIIAGRPTSKDIAEKKAVIDALERKAEANEREMKALEDSLASAVEELTDSVPEILKTDVKVSESSLIGSGTKDGLASGYYIIIGAFSKPENADAMVSKVSGNGYDAVVIPYVNGMSAVGICYSATLEKAAEAYERVSKEAFCPKDAWILKNIR